MTPGRSTLCLPCSKDDYLKRIHDPAAFRRWIDDCFAESPEVFPERFAQGYLLKDARTSAQLGLPLRRIRCKATGQAFTVRPSCVPPSMAGWTDDAANPLFLRRFGVPFWGLAHVFGRDPMYWYRLQVGPGRNSLVGATVRRVAVPVDLAADEHHQTHDGRKVYIATVVAEGCCLEARVAYTCDEAGLTAGYGAFKQEAQDVQPGYAAKTANTDGWKATRLAWRALFPLVVVLRCFLHGWLKIREDCKKDPHFPEASEKVWQAYHAPDARAFSQRIRRLREWAVRVRKGKILERVLRLCGRAKEYRQAYEHPGAHRTSAMLGRVMRSMSGYFDGGQHLHGTAEAAALHVRAWALLYNFSPWGPGAERANGGRRSPAERLDQHACHDNWLHNLLVYASLAGYHRPHPSPQTP
jgi:hypothetical protein